MRALRRGTVSKALNRDAILGKRAVSHEKRMTSTSERDRDFLSRCEQLSLRGFSDGMSVRELAHKVAESPAPGYYISYDYAMRVVSGKAGTENNGSMPDLRNRELCLRVREVSQKRRISKSSALIMVLQSSASRFFISPKRAERMYYEYLTNKREGGKRI